MPTLLETAIDEVKLIQLDVYGDSRGFFTERYSKAAFAELGIVQDFVQDNHSRSAPGVVRGLHYQRNPDQGKLVGVARGAIYDVAVDIRAGSPTFGQYVGAELSDENGRLLWVPAGFAHGFCVMGNGPADVLYKTDGLYNAAGEGGIAFNDPEIGIEWPVAVEPIFSERDAAQPSLKAYAENPAFTYGEV